MFKQLELKRSSKNKKYFHGVNLKEPSLEEFNKYIALWNDKYESKYDDYNHELVLDNVFKDYNNSNKVIKEMYIKCVLLDKLYGTNIKYLDDLIKHLSSIDNFNEMLEQGNPELVNIMKAVKVEDDTINYLSFASKYCRRYNPKAFPIFDSIVKDMLEYYIANTNFYKGAKPDLTDYVQYKEVVDQFIKAYPFVQNYVMLDRYLWAMGKQKLEGINQLKKLKDKDCDNKDIIKICKKVKARENISIAELEDFIIRKYDL